MCWSVFHAVNELLEPGCWFMILSILSCGALHENGFFHMIAREGTLTSLSTIPQLPYFLEILPGVLHNVLDNPRVLFETRRYLMDWIKNEGSYCVTFTLGSFVGTTSQFKSQLYFKANTVLFHIFPLRGVQGRDPSLCSLEADKYFKARQFPLASYTLATDPTIMYNWV